MYSYPHLQTAPPRKPATSGTRGPMPARSSAKQRLVVAVDGTHASASAIEHVLAYKDPRTTLVHLVHVEASVTARDLGRSVRKLVVALRRTESERIIRAARMSFEAHAFECSDEIAYGDPAQAIVRSAASLPSIGIVMGTIGGSVLARLFRRSVSARVVALSHVPVTLVKPQKNGAPQSYSPLTVSAT